MAQFNLDDVKEQSYINEAGRYTLKIKEVAKDQDGCITQLTSTGTEFHKYVCEDINHNRINVSLYMSEKAIWRYKKFLIALGIDTTGMVLDSETFDPRTLIDKKFEADVVRCQSKLNENGEMEESKYFEVENFYPFKG